jgi:Fe2+ transport system protein FeoA
MMNTEMSAVKFLSNLSEGETGEIIQVRGKPEVHRYLYSKGLAMGRIISVDNKGAIAPDTCLTIRSGGKTAIVEKQIAQNIKVRVS